MDWLTQIPNFAAGLLAHWIGLLTGGAGVLLLAFWERKLRPVTFPQYVALAIAATMPAAYMSWLDEHELRVKAETKIVSFKSAAAQRQRFISENLSRFYMEAQSLLHARITIADFPAWAGRERQFSERAESWIKDNMGSAAETKFQDMNGPSCDFAGVSITPEHTGALNWLNKLSANLEALRRDPTWDANAPKLP